MVFNILGGNVFSDRVHAHVNSMLPWNGFPAHVVKAALRRSEGWACNAKFQLASEQGKELNLPILILKSKIFHFQTDLNRLSNVKHI